MQCRYNLSGKSIIDREMADEIIELTKNGMSQQAIADYMGINVKTIVRYKQNNPDFLRRMKKAKYNTDILAFKSVKAGMVRDWRAGRWWIKKRYPKQFGDSIKVDLEKQPILIDDIMGEIDNEKRRRKGKKKKG